MSKYFKLALLVVAVFAIFTIGASAKVYVIDNMDDATLWTGAGVTQETSNIKEGTGAVRVDSTTILQMEHKFATPMDLSAYEDDGVISVWVYVDNTDSFAERDNSLEFTSSGTCDQQESAITLGTEWFEAGWNHLLFTMGDFASYDADWSAINYIRAYKFLNDGSANYWIWDDLKIGLESDFGIGKVKVQDSATLMESFDDPAAFTVDTANAIEGTGCATATGTAPIIIEHKYDTPIDMSRIKDGGYVYVWIYVENAAELQTADGQLELTSSGSCDVNEMGWVLPSLVTFQDGWNEVLLEIDPASECDFSAVNYIRLYLFSNVENTIKIDDLKFGVGEDFGIEPETVATTVAETEAPATAADTTASAADTTAAVTDGTSTSSTSSSTAMIVIIIVAVVIVVVVIVIIAANSKKKKK